MTALMFFYDNSLWLSWPVLGLGLYLLWFCIRAAVRLGPAHRICSLPLAPEQRVELAAPGRVILWLEGPFLSRRFAGLSFELAGPDGSALRGRRALMRQGSSSLSRARIADRVFAIARPGAYSLRVQGLGSPQPGDDGHRLVFMRPYMARTVACVLGIILAALLSIGSIVTVCIRAAGQG